MSERVAIVTGGTGALGRSVVRKFSDEGLKVYVPVVTLHEFTEVFDKSQTADSVEFKLKRIFGFECNAIDENSVIEFLNNVNSLEKGKIDYLINTVGGISPASNVSELQSTELDKMIDLNFKSAFYFTRETLKVMLKNNFGRIISIGAIAGLNTTPGRFAYSFAKAGVINLMDTVSEELKDKNIRCNTIIPGIIDTPANREWGSPDDIKKWTKPEQISDIIYNFISDEFSSVRSSHIKVYGAY